MNAKLAKSLRAHARGASPGMPEVHYVRSRWNGTVRLHPKCTRAIYRKMKSRAASDMTFERHVADQRARKEAAALLARQKRRQRAARRGA